MVFISEMTTSRRSSICRRAWPHRGSAPRRDARRRARSAALRTGGRVDHVGVERIGGALGVDSRAHERLRTTRPGATFGSVEERRELFDARDVGSDRSARLDPLATWLGSKMLHPSRRDAAPTRRA
ncbi:MAG: hypothetical protein H6730_34060 [Deltaproteobacteria bacterium]|nr:hypothetical protein [Deltaproteobacteria bacterium]